MQFLSLTAVSFKIILFPNKQRKKCLSSTREIVKWKISEQRHALLFSLGRSIVVHGSGAGWQGVCVVGGGGVEGKLCNICDIDQALYPTTKKDFILLYKRYSPEKVAFQLQLSLKL